MHRSSYFDSRINLNFEMFIDARESNDSDHVQRRHSLYVDKACEQTRETIQRPFHILTIQHTSERILERWETSEASLEETHQRSGLVAVIMQCNFQT